MILELFPIKVKYTITDKNGNCINSKLRASVEHLKNEIYNKHKSEGSFNIFDYTVEWAIYNDPQDALEILQKTHAISVWNIEDIIFQAKQDNITITNRQVNDVIQYLNNTNNPSIGINWDVISNAISKICQTK